MVLSVSVGFSRSRLTEKAVEEAISKACQNFPTHTNPQCALIFASAEYNQEELIQCLKKYLPENIPFAGCSTEGAFTRQAYAEGTRFISCTLLASEHSQFFSFALTPSDIENSERLHIALTKILKATPLDHQPSMPCTALVFVDGLHVNAAPILKALDEHFPPHAKIMGAAAACRWDRWDATYQYTDQGLLSKGVSGLILCGPINCEYTISHGCSPYGIELEITEYERNRIISLNHQKAWDVVRTQLGFPEKYRSELAGQFCIGEAIQNSPDAWSYIMHAVMGVEDSGTIICGAEFKNQKIILHRRNPNSIIQAAHEASQELYKVTQRKDQWMFQIDCAARGQILLGSQVTEIYQNPIYNIHNSHAWTGLYVFGEIARYQQTTYFLNFTQILMAFSEK